MNVVKKLACAIALTAAATAAQATPLTYTFTGGNFTSVQSPFKTTDKITGTISFDSALLGATGAGSVKSTGSTINSGLTWSFTDGYNVFNNSNTTSNFEIRIDFTSYMPSYWIIDTTSGETPQADIWVQSNAAYTSFYKGSKATGSATSLATAANWANTTPTAVPEPGSIALMGLGLAGLAALRRRKSA